MSKPLRTYGRLGKKRAQQTHSRSNAAGSDSDTLESLSSPTRSTHQPSDAKSKREDRPRQDERPSKIPRSERPVPSSHKKSHLPVSLARSSHVQQPQPGLGPSNVTSIVVQDAHPKRKHVESSPHSGYDTGNAVPGIQTPKRRKIQRAAYSDSDATEHSGPSPPPNKLSSSSASLAAPTAAARKTPYSASCALSNMTPPQNGSATNEPAADNHTAPASSTLTPPGSRPATPKKLPPDLSRLFANHGLDQLENNTTTRNSPSPSHTSQSSSTPRRAKMLSRSATFPGRDAVASTSQSISADAGPILSPISRSRTSTVQKTASWPMLSPSPSKSDGSPVTNLQRASEMQHDAPLSRPTLRTYSASRSFLVPLSSATPGDHPSLQTDDLESQDAIQHESYADLRKKYRVDLSSDDDMETGISGPVDLKNISELRDKGENRRFMDDMGYLLEGLAPKMSIAVKRLSAIKLVDNMGDLNYIKRAKSCDAVGTAWDALEAAGDGDKVLDAAIVSFAALATRDPRFADEFARQPFATRYLSRLLGAVPSSDPFGFSNASDRLEEARRLGIGKPERAMIAQLRGILLKSKVLGDNDYCTSRRLCTQSLLAMLVHNKDMLPPLLESLLHETDALLRRLQSYNIGLPIMPDPAYDTPDIQHINNIVQILESSLLLTKEITAIQGASLDQRKHIVTNLMKTSIICTALDHRNSEPKGALTCLSNILRLLVKLADATPDWAIGVARIPHCISHLVRIATLYHQDRAVGDRDILAGDRESDANRLDIKCLALALLTSVLLEESTNRLSVFQSKISPNCGFGRSCVAHCQCRGRVHATQALTDLYLDETEKSHNMSNPEAAFLKGHLAILLGLACEGAERANMVSVLKNLPGSNDRAKLDAWIDTIREFMDLYSDLAKGFAQAMKLSRQNDETRDPEDGDGEDMSQPGDGGMGRDRSPEGANFSATLFSLEEPRGGEKGVEIAERVIRVLKEFRE